MASYIYLVAILVRPLGCCTFDLLVLDSPVVSVVLACMASAASKTSKDGWMLPGFYILYRSDLLPAAVSIPLPYTYIFLFRMLTGYIFKKCSQKVSARQ